ncbi:site-specific DNA-methyltransferase [Methylosinus sp. Ce-a6]|uniref:site-specific DNA-methyltransferase n=1 Tax=Methylosinus sp. Ce-a6 TaxID=2172005 RepID=UPI00135C7FAF|nr:site-specific DNA-methyltransferase [Methylosinus sp. Ce-a6]
MATGVPRRPKRKIVTNGQPVQLSYPGRRDAVNILATAPGIFEIAPITTKSGRANRLYFGDNLSVLTHLNQDPAVRGKVRLAYIDPPYATQTVFHSRELKHAYEDIYEQCEYLEFMRERLLFLHSLLADNGTIYVHLDAKMLFHVKILMDEIFGADNFRNCITRRKSNPKNFTRKQFGSVSDYILFYSKSASYVWNRVIEPWTEHRAREYQYVEPGTGRRFMKVPVHAPGIRHGATGGLWRGMKPPPGKHWQYTPEALDEMDARGEIFWSKNGNPRRKVYLDTNPGVPAQDIWMDFVDAQNQNISITGYPTEKPYELLMRIVEASSNPGDLVLDCFAGSGTTLVAADMLKRRWIGADNSPEAIRTMLHRFQHGTQRMGDFVKKASPQGVLFEEEHQARSILLHQVIEDFICFVEAGKELQFPQGDG